MEDDLAAGDTTIQPSEVRRMMSETTSTAFGPLLKEHRLAAGLTQETLAERAGVSARSIRALERGQTAPHQDTVRRLAQALALDTEQRAAFAAAATARPRRRPRRPASDSATPAAPVTEHTQRALPPSPGTGMPPHNLPLQLTTFIGRAQELADLTHLLTRTRLLMLSGPAGVGKSRVALQLAEHVRHRYPQGIWLVDLGPLADPTLVPYKVAKTLGLVENPDRSLLTALAQQLRLQHLLLVLDNCEHLLDACTALAETLLRADPHVQILATSREPLGLAGETTWIVPPLTIPDASSDPQVEDLGRYEAVQFFVERAQAAQPGFTLTASNAEAVAQICRRLDGLPLALELAAARVRTLGVAGVAAHLDRAFALLTGGSRTALPRHRMLRAALDWSYDLLTVPERVLFARLSVFAGRFTLEAVEEICAGEEVTSENVLELLLGVVDKSLVQIDDADGGARYRLLETVRQYGRERLVTRGDMATMQAHHAAYYLALVERDQPDMPGRAPVTRLDRLEGELDNLRAALTWCLDDAAPAVGAEDRALLAGRHEMGLRLAGALMDVWYWRAHRLEGVQWLDRALARDSGAPTAARARALVGAGSLVWMLGNRPRGEERFREAIAIYRTLGQTVDLAFAYCLFGFWLRGSQYWLRGPASIEPTPADYHEGTTMMDAGLAVVQEVGDPAHIAWAGVLSAESADLRDAHDRADAWSKAEDSLLVFQEIGDPQGIGLANHTLGTLALYERDYARAQAAFAAAVAAFRAFGDVAEVALDMAHLGYVAQAQGNVDAATRHYEDSLALYRQIEFDHDLMSWVLRNLGDLALEHGDIDGARARYAESLVRAQEARKPVPIAEALDAAARLFVVEGKTVRAAKLSATAAAVRAAAGQPLQLAERAALGRAVAQARRALTRVAAS